MATEVFSPIKQSLTEIRQWDFDFNPDLPSGVTVTSAVATHTPPSGTASTPTVGSDTENVVPVMLGPLTVVGMHVLSCVATLSDNELSEIILFILVIE